LKDVNIQTYISYGIMIFAGNKTSSGKQPVIKQNLQDNPWSVWYLSCGTSRYDSTIHKRFKTII